MTASLTVSLRDRSNDRVKSVKISKTLDHIKLHSQKFTPIHSLTLRSKSTCLFNCTFAQIEDYHFKYFSSSIVKIIYKILICIYVSFNKLGCFFISLCVFWIFLLYIIHSYSKLITLEVNTQHGNNNLMTAVANMNCVKPYTKQLTWINNLHNLIINI